MSFIFGAFVEVEDVFQCQKVRGCGRPSAGFGVVDLVYDVGGAIATELVFWGASELLGDRRPRRLIFLGNGEVGLRLPLPPLRF